MCHRVLLLAMIFTSASSGCSGCLSSPPEGIEEDPCNQDERPADERDDPIAFSALQHFERCNGPVLRDDENDDDSHYETASDGHVFIDEQGRLSMVYSGDVGGHIAPKFARGSDWDSWERLGPMMATAKEGDVDLFRETPFYRLAEDGTHQLFYIGYADEKEYKSQIYLAESNTIEGPYVRTGEPVIKRGMQAQRDVYLMTSPSVVSHEGELFMVYLAWNNNPDKVSEVWVMAATSSDDGRTWSDIREVDVPVGMEGQITPGPDGFYYATSLSEYDRTEAIYLARAPHPLGPYEKLPEPVLIKEGKPWEVHESNAPQIVFDETTRTAYLYYVGASYLFGWWTLLAQARY